ncbi:hypothetical protein GCM10020367_13510 [Streptomyces sannanensis]|uniref:DUF3099 domain-containing protein n=1 Tax=Streptomyces sannanensis TaxID=285536 RepID=A0ABP6S6X9_9ACTN
MWKHSGSEVFRITGARQGLAADVRGRQRRYVISMSVRTVSFLLAVALWNIERYVAFVALALGLLLPYIAVVIANAGRERAPSLPSTFDLEHDRHMLGPAGSAPSAEPRPEAADGAEDASEDPDR